MCIALILLLLKNIKKLYFQVISKKLVTFHDIEELQETNQKLLAVVRDLSEELENAENKFKECKKEELEVSGYFYVSYLKFFSIIYYSKL